MQSDNFIAEHQGLLPEAKGINRCDVSIFGQDYNHTTWQLAAMNMVIRGVDFNFGKEPANTFTNDQHPELRADFVMANPPFNMKEWDTGVDDNDPRWQYGKPPPPAMPTLPGCNTCSGTQWLLGPIASQRLDELQHQWRR